MKLPLGITLTLLLILQTFQQVSAKIPDEWKRDNVAMNNNETQSSSENPPVTMGENIENTQAKPESSLKDEGQSFGSYTFTGGDQQQQNYTKPDNGTEEVSSERPIATTPPTMIAVNSSSEPSYTTAESNETQILGTATNTSTLEPEHTNQTALNDTYTSPNPENTTTESSLNETGSGYFPSDNLSTNSTTESPATTTTDESIQNITTLSPTEPPVNRTTTLVTPSAIPDSEGTEANLTGPFDKDNSERGLSSDVTDATESKRGQAWTIVLGIGIVVGIIALAAFIILNQRNRRDFSHRKLVDETSPDPVLRLDNSEPLDLKFDGFGYYNAGLQGDNIQMTNFPQGRSQ